jgi:hypothetical protein
VVEWFLEEERPKGVGTERNTGKVASWFHGESKGITIYIVTHGKYTPKAYQHNITLEVN